MISIQKFCFVLLFASGQVKANSQMTPKEFFKNLNINTMNLVDEFYAPDVRFKDAVTSLEGSKAVRAHYEHQYANLSSIRWEFRSELKSADSYAFEWTMILAHSKLNGGKEFSVEGASVLKFNQAGLVNYHRDYFDMGEFIYSKIPLLKWIDSKIKDLLKSPENK